MPRSRSLRLAAVALLMAALLLPAHSAMAGSRNQDQRAENAQVRVFNPQVWIAALFAQAQVTISAILPINPKPIAVIKPKPTPDPDPPQQPFGGGGGGGCPTCSGGGGGNGGDTGSGSDPDGG